MVKRREKVALMLTLLLGVLAIIGSNYTVKLIHQDYVMYQKESECIAKYIRTNYRRADIVTGNGTCWIKGTEE